MLRSLRSINCNHQLLEFCKTIDQCWKSPFPDNKSRRKFQTQCCLQRTFLLLQLSTFLWLQQVQQNPVSLFTSGRALKRRKLLSGQSIEEYPVIESSQRWWEPREPDLLSETQRVKCQWVFAEQLCILCNAIDEIQSVRQK